MEKIPSTIRRNGEKFEEHLCKVICKSQTEGDTHLPLLLMFYRAGIHEITGFYTRETNFLEANEIAF